MLVIDSKQSLETVSFNEYFTRTDRNLSAAALDRVPKIEIEFPTDEQRARRVVSRSNHRVTGKHPGFKSRRMHYWESHLERDAFVLLDSMAEVDAFREQPAILYYGDNCSLRHYPDLLVTCGDRQIFVEIKTEQEASSDEIVERTNLLVPALAKHGYGYHVMTDAVIRRSTTRLANLRYLLRFGRAALKLIDFEWFRRLFLANSVVEWQSIVGSPTDTSRLIGLCRLILEGRLKADLEQPIVSDSLVFGGRI